MTDRPFASHVRNSRNDVKPGHCCFKGALDVSGIPFLSLSLFPFFFLSTPPFLGSKLGKLYSQIFFFFQRWLKKELLANPCLSVVAQSCPTLCDPMDCSPPDSSVHGILQARILEWVAISFSRDLPNPGIKLGSSASQADALPSEPPGKPQGKYFFEPHFLGGGRARILEWVAIPFSKRSSQPRD